MNAKVKIKQLKKEIYDYVKTSILNSNIEDWIEDKSILIGDDKILINIYNSDFTVTIYKNPIEKGKMSPMKVHNYEIKVFFIHMFTKYKLYKKHREIMNLIKNKDQFEYWTECHSLLPIKEIRKNKLKNIEQNID